ncbi:hypothetical protein KP001_14415 [Geomonas subterranea]|uniref:Uncharacterized protein n=1 Tax=Geomonas subterranea TaxID=2847989 RepID=A0ABX8LD96_9BACT|nr:hypothetical protein [Geomonas subterranea]QXE89627.1 hypothetical protein KP001_14415 [Geomonas subterranea]QXM08257.1 hypothetical protein KP002_14865 [Geomonas subterranea]
MLTSFRRMFSLGSLNQQKGLAAGIALVVLIGMFPPWIITYKAGEYRTVTKDLGYVFIATPPSYTRPTLSSSYETLGRIDIQRLLVQWAIVAIATGGFCLLLPKKELLDTTGGVGMMPTTEKQQTPRPREERVARVKAMLEEMEANPDLYTEDEKTEVAMAARHLRIA